MSFLSQEMPTLDHYAFNLRDGLRRAAVTTLSELEGSINDLGYGWLDGYMEQIMDRQNRAPITELMKTPSRTQTSKKTRANTAAAKERTDKVKGLNARLALSPSTKQNSRSALSPLQPRSLNVSTLSPTPVATPKAGISPVKSKPEKAKPKPKAKKGKSKKAVENDENSPPTSVDNTTTSFSTSEKSKSSVSSSAKNEVVEKKSKSTRSKSKKTKEKPEEVAEQPMEVEIERSVPQAEPIDEAQLVDEEEVEPIEIEQEVQENAVSEPESVAKELSIVVEAEEKSASSTQQANSPVQVEEEAEEVETVEEPMAEVAHETQPEAVTEQMERVDDAEPEARDEIAFETAKEEDVPSQSNHDEPERKVDPTMPTSFANPSVPAGTSQPIRQVRSSWLSKALGSNAVPVNGLPATDAGAALRKSYASAQRPSTTLDFAGLRKSLAPINGLKRKSDHGMDEEEEEEEVEEERRPEKTAKFNVDIPVPNYTDALPARTPGPMGRPNMPSKTPSFGSTGVISQPNSLSRSTVQNDNPRSDIHKVTKALDELREKTAAKELAKQKAALAASTGAAGRVPQAKSTGTGFLRGLGSIGAGLLGLGGSDPEEEAQRLARELEEERLAELELERLMKEANRSETQVEVEEKDMEVDDDEPIVRSTTPKPASPQQKAQAPMSPEEEEEMIEEQSVVEELMPVDSRISMASTQRQPSAPVDVEPQSTTPTGTPTRAPAKYTAPALHAREEKHAHEPSVALQKEKERLASAMNKVEPAKMKVNPRKMRESSVDEDEEMEEDDEFDELSEEEEEVVEVQKPHRAPPVVEIKTHRKTPSSSSVAPTPLNMSTSSVVTTGSVLSQGQSMAAKALGVKPATGPVKSLQLAAAAAKKEQAAAERKANLKEAEVRRQQAAKKKAEEERIRADEERKAKIAEIEEKRRLRAEFEKRQKERADKAALAAKEKADKEKAEREAQVAKLRAAEEEAARKRKMAAQTAALNKSQNKPSAKPPTGSSTASSLQQSQKGKEPFKPIKQATLGSSTSTMGLSGKMGPSAFRTAETSAQSSTITLVTQNQQNGNGERRPLGPPSRPSQQPQSLRTSTAVPSHANSILQQSRVALQSQLDEKAAMVQSEDIELPDINSEYSDSDDEDRTKDFIPPTWAESPQLRAALEAQAHRNPDELFGPIKPLNMEELFKVRTNKFRARTSSANWSKTGDGLTKAEEVEYARRMGFKAMPSGLGGGSGSGGQ